MDFDRPFVLMYVILELYSKASLMYALFHPNNLLDLSIQLSN